MLRFFRQLRKDQLMSEKTRKYLLYALGEIALVMVGILLALQVNNWNQERMEENQQAETISRLYAEFQSNYDELIFDLTRLQDVIDALESIISMIDSSELENYSENEIVAVLAASGTDPTWNPSSFVLEDLKSNGQISSLRNDKLVDLIFSWERFYENVIEFQINFVEINNDYIEHVRDLGLIVNIGNHFEITNSASPASSRSILSEDKQLYNVTHHKLIQAHFLKQEYLKTAEKLKEIIDLAEN